MTFKVPSAASISVTFVLFALTLLVSARQPAEEGLKNSVSQKIADKNSIAHPATERAIQGTTGVKEKGELDGGSVRYGYKYRYSDSSGDDHGDDEDEEDDDEDDDENDGEDEDEDDDEDNDGSEDEDEGDDEDDDDNGDVEGGDDEGEGEGAEGEDGGYGKESIRSAVRDAYLEGEDDAEFDEDEEESEKHIERMAVEGDTKQPESLRSAIKTPGTVTADSKKTLRQ